MVQLHKSVIVIGTAILLLSCISAFKYRKIAVDGPAHLKNFYLYSLLTLAMSFSSLAFLLLRSYSFHAAALIEKIIQQLDSIFWIYFFYRLNIRNSRWLQLFIILSGLGGLIFAGMINANERLPYFAMGVANFTSCIFCLIYLYNLFSSPPTIILGNDPEFWIVIGLFFYTAVTIPIYITTAYVYVNMKMLIFQLFSFTNIAIIIMHLSFIKGFSSVGQCGRT